MFRLYIFKTVTKMGESYNVIQTEKNESNYVSADNKITKIKIIQGDTQFSVSPQWDIF
jgi:hypothetical protein